MLLKIYRFLKRLENKIYSIYIRFHKWLNRDNNIYLVYTMGKVGSTSIYKALKTVKQDAEVHHVHFLSPNFLDHILPRLHQHFHRNIALGKSILALIAEKPKARLKIITLTREPIERSISDLFQN